MTLTETLAWLTTLRNNARTVNDSHGEPLALACEEAIACVTALVAAPTVGPCRNGLPHFCANCGQKLG